MPDRTRAPRPPIEQDEGPELTTRTEAPSRPLSDVRDELSQQPQDDETSMFDELDLDSEGTDVSWSEDDSEFEDPFDDRDVDEEGKQEGNLDGAHIERDSDGEGHTEVSLDLGESNEGPEVVSATTSGIDKPDPQFKQMRVMIYTPYTGSGNDLDELSGGSTVDKRLELLEENLAEAMQQSDEAGDGPDVLRIFMAPEWFFSRRNEAYNVQEMAQAIKGLEELSTRYPNVLLVPGSILWTDEKSAPPEPEKKKSWNPFAKKKEPEPFDKRGDLLHNTTGAFMGGKSLAYYSKQRDGSDTRFNSRSKGPTLNTDVPNIDKWVENPEQTERHSSSAPHQFELDGLKMGLEICADNGSGMLMRELYDENPEHEGVDVQMVVACGLGGGIPQAGTSSAKEGGYTLLADGLRSNDEGARRTKPIAQVGHRDGSVVESSRKQHQGVKGEDGQDAVVLDELPTQELTSKRKGGQNKANLLRMSELLPLPGRGPKPEVQPEELPELVEEPVELVANDLDTLPLDEEQDQPLDLPQNLLEEEITDPTQNDDQSDAIVETVAEQEIEERVLPPEDMPVPNEIAREPGETAQEREERLLNMDLDEYRQELKTDKTLEQELDDNGFEEKAVDGDTLKRLALAQACIEHLNREVFPYGAGNQQEDVVQTEGVAFERMKQLRTLPSTYGGNKGTSYEKYDRSDKLVGAEQGRWAVAGEHFKAGACDDYAKVAMDWFRSRAPGQTLTHMTKSNHAFLVVGDPKLPDQAVVADPWPTRPQACLWRDHFCYSEDAKPKIDMVADGKNTRKEAEKQVKFKSKKSGSKQRMKDEQLSTTIDNAKKSDDLWNVRSATSGDRAIFYVDPNWSNEEKSLKKAEFRRSMLNSQHVMPQDKKALGIK